MVETWLVPEEVLMALVTEDAEGALGSRKQTGKDRSRLPAADWLQGALL